MASRRELGEVNLAVNSNAAQVAGFYVDHVVGYRAAHTGAPALIPAGPVALTSVNNGGASATWTARLVATADGFEIQVTGSATETVRWTGSFIILSAGS